MLDCVAYFARAAKAFYSGRVHGGNAATETPPSEATVASYRAARRREIDRDARRRIDRQRERGDVRVQRANRRLRGR